MTSHTRLAPVLVLAAILSGLGACGPQGIRFRSPVMFGNSEAVVGPGQVTASAIQSEVMSFTDTFSAAIAQQWNRVAAQARAESSPRGLAAPGAEQERASRLRRSALESKLATVSAALSIAASPNPKVALADMITMITLQRMVLETPRSAELYGPETTADLVATYREHEAKAWRIAERAMTPQQQQELRDLIAQWRAEHPDDTYVANVRLEDFANARQQTVLPGGGGGGSLLALVALDPLAGLDPAQREVQKSRMLGERVFYYASRSPLILKWQVESLYQSLMTAPEFRQTLASVERTSHAAAKLSDIAEALPDEIATERAAAIDQLFTRLAEERHASIQQVNDVIQAQRVGFLQDLDQAQGTFQGTLKDFQATAEVTDRAAATLTTAVRAIDTFAARFDRPEGAPPPPENPDGDVLARYTEAAARTGEAAERLTALSLSLDRLLAAPALGTTGLHAAVGDLHESSRALIDQAFWRLLILVIVTPFTVALAAWTYRRAVHR